MRRSKKPITLVARSSRLARVQAEMVGRGLQRVHPELEVRYHWVVSEGDQHTDVPLADRGGKGLFTGVVERALLQGHADLAVHSMKDVPADAMTPGLALAAVPMRGDARDCLIGREGPTTLDALPQGAVVGTSSPRRAAQLHRVRPDLRPHLLRGNVDTRLQRLRQEGGPYDAALFAAAGLRRLGMAELLPGAMAVEDVMPAASQGALCLQCRADDHVTITRCLPLNDPETSTAIHAERELVHALGADCHSPLAVFANPVDPAQTVAKRNADAHWFRLRAEVYAHDGSTTLAFDRQIKTKSLRRLVKEAAADLKSQGAGELLQSARSRGAALTLPGQDLSAAQPTPISHATPDPRSISA